MRWSSAGLAAVLLLAGCCGEGSTTVDLHGSGSDPVTLAKQRFADALARGVDMRRGP